MNSLNSAPALETNLEIQTVLYPTLQQLVRLLPWNRKRVVDYIREEAKHNPFLTEISDASALSNKGEVLIEDVLPDWYNPPAQGLSLREHLYGQIAALSIPSKQREPLIYLTQWLSSSGYLEETPQVWAIGNVWSAKELQAVVPLLQSLDPPGIGARSLKECLLLQLKDQPQSLAFLLVQEYLEELANCTSSSSEARHNCEVLLQKLHQRQQVSVDADIKRIIDAIHEIQELEPRPARNFGNNNAPVVTPDLKAEQTTKGGWQVSLTYEVEQRFCLNAEAVKLLKKPPLPASRRDTQRLEALLQQAQSLLTALHQWQENLLKVGQFLVERQQTFLQSRDTLDLTPTPQQLVAQSVGLSNSTVSRIVRGRYILICDQYSRIIPLHSLCVPVKVGGRTSVQIQQLLVQLIEEESSAHPYSDEQLAQLLKVRFGLPITRRTVTKYRQIAGINSSHHRRLVK
ncbi:MAG: RNA polymerase subunit sigma-54 [Stigonema ocellatum SAG 48.90 = DSM 106950]|nr:RNA polymerase subunit sigma-54 [Stigonema ocellatum SAG 48.90 = DSM 106950]